MALDLQPSFTQKLWKCHHDRHSARWATPDCFLNHQAPAIQPSTSPMLVCIDHDIVTRRLCGVIDPLRFPWRCAYSSIAPAKPIFFCKTQRALHGPSRGRQTFPWTLNRMFLQVSARPPVDQSKKQGRGGMKGCLFFPCQHLSKLSCSWGDDERRS